MTQTDQCPSSHKEGKPSPKQLSRSARDVSRATGRAYWRSLDDAANTPEFREFLHREFPENASELLDGSRRGFLKLMGASLALAGAATIPGCRQPDHKILAYNKDPEHIIPGKPLFYASAMPLPGGGCEGLLIETYEGRPTKVEGNPLHPANLGKSSIWAQASMLAMYDPDRDPEVIADQSARSGMPIDAKTGWKVFVDGSKAAFAKYDADGGAKLAFMVEKATSPSRDDLRDRIQKRWPKARWYAFDGVDNENAIAGSKIAFGGVFRESLDLSKANVIVSLDRDFLHGEENSMGVSRGYAASRIRTGDGAKFAAGSTMSRLYVAESNMTLTGGAADHRFCVKSSQIGGFAAKIAERVFAKLAPADAAKVAADVAKAASGAGLPEDKIFDAIAEDLLDPANKGKSAILAGASQPPEVHALCHALNSALGNAGQTIRYVELTGDAGQSSLNSITALARELDAGTVESLVIIGGNPVYGAPGDIDLAAKIKKLGYSVYLGAPDETAAAVKTYIPRAHYLEAWGDVETFERQYSVIQPMIKPLWGGVSELEVLGTILGDGVNDGYAVVQRTFQSKFKLGLGSDKAWRRTLHDGVYNTDATFVSPHVNAAGVIGAIPAIAGQFKLGVSTEYEVVFVASPNVFDGRFANNGWLQELAHPVSKVSWDNPALISKKTAEALGITLDRHPTDQKYDNAQIVTVTLGDKKLTIAAWVQPGIADNTIILHTGYGRTRCGRVGDATGFNVNPLRRSSPGPTGSRIATGVAVAKDAKADWYLIANTQDHWTMEGRGLIREIDLDAWKTHGDEDYSKDKSVQIDPYDNSRHLNMAGRLGMEGHAPANIDIYRKVTGEPLRGAAQFYIQVDDKGQPVLDDKGRVQAPQNKYGKRVQQWGMSIDLTTCTGCSACTIACQAENNIPIVGKIETAKGREMHWIRVDRYYASDPEGKDPYYDATNPDMVVQPVACVHCENAPCEVVCPVNATIHDTAGMNNMAYNRCIGTKYCSNNCPYKVRRFNWFDYGTKQYKGNWGQVGQPLAMTDVPTPENPNWIPPRLREKNHPVQDLQKNPHVTVRSRGMMEKCSYCIQRINAASIETKISDLKHIPDGFIQTACQQACPTGAIVFGDIYDYEANEGKGSKASNLRRDPRAYALLAYLNTRPRTTHLVRVRNPNPKIRRPIVDPFVHHGAEHEGHSETPAGGGEHHAQRSPGHLLSLPVLSNARTVPGVLA